MKDSKEVKETTTKRGGTENTHNSICVHISVKKSAQNHITRLFVFFRCRSPCPALPWLLHSLLLSSFCPPSRLSFFGIYVTLSSWFLLRQCLFFFIVAVVCVCFFAGNLVGKTSLLSNATLVLVCSESETPVNTIVFVAFSAFLLFLLLFFCSHNRKRMWVRSFFLKKCCVFWCVCVLFVCFRVYFFFLKSVWLLLDIVIGKISPTTWG